MGLTELKRLYDNEVTSFLFFVLSMSEFTIPRMQRSTSYSSGNESTQVFHVGEMHWLVLWLISSVLSPIVQVVNEYSANLESLTRNGTTTCQKKRFIRLQLLKWTYDATKLVLVCFQHRKSTIFRISSHQSLAKHQESRCHRKSKILKILM